MRRTTRPSRPNQRTCKHDFHRLATVDPNVPGRIRQPVGVRLACSKCALIRTIFDSGDMHDGPVQVPVQSFGSVGYDTDSIRLATRSRTITAAEQLNNIANMMDDVDNSTTYATANNIIPLGGFDTLAAAASVNRNPATGDLSTRTPL